MSSAHSKEHGPRKKLKVKHIPTYHKGKKHPNISQNYRKSSGCSRRSTLITDVEASYGSRKTQDKFAKRISFSKNLTKK
jgi:hypothetical protein